MIGNEDKTAICEHICEALKRTRHCEGLEPLTFYEATEEVVAIWDSGRRSIINVACDSGWGMIQDIMKAMAYGG